jgi:hypothetical protein
MPSLLAVARSLTWAFTLCWRLADPVGPESKPPRESCSADLVGGRSCLRNRTWYSPRRGHGRPNRSSGLADRGRVGACNIGDERRTRGAGRPRRRADPEHGGIHRADCRTDIHRCAGSFRRGERKRRPDDRTDDGAACNESADTDDATDIDDRATCGEHGTAGIDDRANRGDHTPTGRDNGATCPDHATARSDDATSAGANGAAHAGSHRTARSRLACGRARDVVRRTW